MRRNVARQRRPYLGNPTARCNICQNDFLVIFGYYTCEDADNFCDYDVCNNCYKGGIAQHGLTCSEGLPLGLSITKRDRYWGFGAICNVCQRKIEDVRNGYYICPNAHSSCNFDCCKACYKGPK